MMSDIYLTREEIEHPYADIKTMIEDKRRKAEQMRKTVFAKITASPEVLAEEFVEMMFDPQFGDYQFFSMLTYEFYETRAKAFDATLTRLNAPAEINTEREE